MQRIESTDLGILEKAFNGKFEEREIKGWGKTKCMDIDLKVEVKLPNNKVIKEEFNELRFDAQQDTLYIGKKENYTAIGVWKVLEDSFVVVLGYYYDVKIGFNGDTVEVLQFHDFDVDHKNGYKDWY